MFGFDHGSDTCIGIGLRNVRARLRDKSIIIYEGKGSFAGKVFQVGNIGDLSDDDIRSFLSSLKDVLLTLQTEAAELVVPVRPNQTPPAVLPVPVPAHVRVVS